MDLFDVQWIGFLALFLGTLFLLGEVLVNMRGIFGLLGIGFISVYFTAYLDTDSVLLIVIVYFIGLLLIIIDGKIVNDGTLATLGLGTMIAAVALPQPNLASGLYAVIALLFGTGLSLVFLKVFKRRKMWTKLALMDQLTKEAGYSSLSKEYEDLLETEGEALTDFRPSGTVEINKKHYSAVTGGQWLEKGSKVKVVEVDGTKIRIEKIDKPIVEE
ncbi:NfeD family protein [Oceanobacillus iheyensis]|uniref:Hypothetical conserved protein n=1 Tax=Oceanobacillus iheyensis (strain DSM 14371 / CIP 107618 / JCM 11309 / KCTC 3954 / HTE831) TaxID=221109 RepID=Q8EPZ6_OCEIH|nr:NfeD family protein [Oceanobacillus iheyensis]BAC13890.1 hypothetical conserved protein [Oceanobacillus iheyensis HTE831]